MFKNGELVAKLINGYKQCHDFECKLRGDFLRDDYNPMYYVQTAQGYISIDIDNDNHVGSGGFSTSIRSVSKEEIVDNLAKVENFLVQAKGFIEKAGSKNQ